MTQAALERLFDAPDDRAAWELLADEWLSQGDLRGELVSLALAGKQSRHTLRHKKALHKLLGEHQARFEERSHVEFAHGLWAKVSMEIPNPHHGPAPAPDELLLGELATKALTCPLATFVRELRLVFAQGHDLHWFFRSMEGHGRALRVLDVACLAWSVAEALQFPRLREVNFEGALTGMVKHATLEKVRLVAPIQCRVSWVSCPRLVELELRMHVDTLPRLETPMLKRLLVPTHADVVAWASELPLLEDFTLLDVGPWTLEPDVLGRALRAGAFPALRRFRGAPQYQQVADAELAARRPRGA